MKTTALLCAGAFAFAAAATAQSSDALLNKLVQKGILSESEAKELRADVDKDFAKAFSAKTGMPDWVTALKFSGDLRLRYEGFYLPNQAAPAGSVASVDRHRFRYRLRFGTVATIKDRFEVGLRLTSDEAATGGTGGDPISGNATFMDNGSKKFIYIDQAYGKWTAVQDDNWSLTLTGGKMENPLGLSDIAFDGDYMPEGAAVQLSRKLCGAHSLRFVGGGFALEEQAALSDDAYLFAGVLRLESKWNDHLRSSIGGGFLSIMGSDTLLTANVPNQSFGNSRTAAGALRHNYNPYVADASVTWTLKEFPGYKGAFPIRFAGDYLHNPNVQSENKAWSAGVTFGKSGKKGTWDVGYRYKYVGGDAWYEEMVDSDFGGYYGALPANGALNGVAAAGPFGYRGGTNVRGHAFSGTYSPYDSFSIGVTCILAELINDSPAAAPASNDSGTGRLQVNLVWKF